MQELITGAGVAPVMANAKNISGNVYTSIQQVVFSFPFGIACNEKRCVAVDHFDDQGQVVEAVVVPEGAKYFNGCLADAKGISGIWNDDRGTLCVCIF